MSEALPYPTDYLDQLQQAALAWLRRHQARHLGEQVLFSGAVSHLQVTLGANREIAENTVARAYGELRSADEPRYLDISSSTGKVAVLVDPRSGMTYAVPVKVILERVIDAPDRRRLQSVPGPAGHIH